MTIAKYPVPPATSVQSKDHLSRHLAAPREAWEFTSDDIQEPITFATILTLDTLAPVIMAVAKGDPTQAPTLSSGWSCSPLNLSTPKHVDLMFTAPGEANEGFILRIKLSKDENEFRTVSAYTFTDRKYWNPSPRKLVVNALKTGRPWPAAFEYVPQVYSFDLPLMTHGPARPYDPEGVLTVLPQLVEALREFNPELFASCVASHSKALYYTLFPEKQDILIATRGIMATDGHVAGSALNKMVNILWRTGMAMDLVGRIDDVDGLAKLLAEQGNTSKRAEYDFDDDKYGAYIKSDAETTTVYFRHERDAMAVRRSADRLVISAANYKTGEFLETYADMSFEDGRVTEIHDAAPLRSHVTALLRRWVREIEGLGEMMAEAAPGSGYEALAP